MSVTLQQAVRATLVERLRRDLLGPETEEEVLIQDRETREGDSPLTRYLLGVLYPADTLVDPEDDDASSDGTEGEEDDTPDTPVPLTGIPKPSSIGLSLAIDNQTHAVRVTVRYGLYEPHETTSAPLPAAGDGSGNPKRRAKPTTHWRRRQVSATIIVILDTAGQQTLDGGARLEWLCRAHDGTRTVSVFLRNTNHAGTDHDEPEDCLFQPEIIVRGPTDDSTPIINRAHHHTSALLEPELESYRLLYRDKPEFSVGHGCATTWDHDGCPPDRARQVSTELMPTHELATTVARGGIGLKALSMEFLAAATATGEDIRSALQPLLHEYESWITDRDHEIGTLPASLRPKATEHLADCRDALCRMTRGLDLIATDPLVREAFVFTNQAMHLQRVKSVEGANFQKERGRIFDDEPPAWRPFQLAFILLNLDGIANPQSPDRDLVDLLWFPTGGGKTEAYLGLATFTMGLRRLRQSTTPITGVTGDGGVTVLMRYTLRLLTIQQFQRAATLICACETLRAAAPNHRLGNEPFSIGLWVGGGSTPNKISQRPDPDHGREPGALQALASFDPQNEPTTGNPVQLRSCPWCSEPLSHHNYTAHERFLHLQLRCPNPSCDFRGSADNPLSGIPAYLVDEDLYLRCPTMVIGTVDKFARLPWDPKTKALFGIVDRHCDRHGYLATGADYQSCGGRHNATGDLPATSPPRAVPPFLPPTLIIQDELHLITGPLGSLMGLYETGVDLLATQTSGQRPKVIASTATIRRYQDQIQGLFDRDARQFPPPGLIAGDSFFAAETRDKPGRVYVGICAPGRSMKTAAVRLLGSLLHSAQLASTSQPARVVDPYWTLVYYFNSLRELGGAVRLLDDDVRHRLTYLAHNDGIPVRVPDRHPELTSRISARDVTVLLKRMEATLASGDALDVLLATNMLSVGVDIQRFGLMLVTGQPKTSAEYIQATSRVGRQTPGVIFTLYNWSRPRDLSHYERFTTYHSMLYRHVEVSSVTPFSRRARDKALHSVFVALVRLLDPRMTKNDAARNFNPQDPIVQRVTAALIDRVGRNDPDEAADARTCLQAFIDGWVEQQQRFPRDLRYRKPGQAPATPRTWLLQAAEDGQGEDFPRGTLNSLREVERTSGLYFKNLRRVGARP